MTYLRAMRGNSQSHLLAADDGNFYVVKSPDNPQGLKIVFNEWLGACIARQMGLPVPEWRQILVTSQFLQSNPCYGASYSSGSISYRAGVHFGSSFMGGLLPGKTLEYLPPEMLLRISNLGDFIGALVFDKWTCNADGRQAVYSCPKMHSRYSATLIDNGFCFNAEKWRLQDAPLKGCFWPRSVYAGVDGWTAFEPWLARLETCDEAFLASSVQSMPHVWWEADSAKVSSLLEQLLKRRTQLPDLIQETRKAIPSMFPKWS